MSTATRTLGIVAALGLAAGVAVYLQRRPAADPGVGGSGAGRDSAQAVSGVPGMSGMSGLGGGAKGSTTRAVPVTVAAVETRDMPIRLRAVGRTEAWQTVTLRARIDAQIIGVHYRPGQAVTRGQKMVTLDGRAIQAQLQQSRANLARDRAQWLKAQADLQRYGELVQKGFVSSAQLDVYKASVDSLAATVAAGQAAIDLARVQLSYTTVTAPMNGVAGAVLAFPGGIVRANDTPLVSINQVNPIYVTFPIPESRLAEVPRGASAAPRVEVTVPATAGGQAPRSREGELVFIDNAVDPTTGTIVMKAKLDNRDAGLTPGQFVEVSMVLRMLPGALVMPAEAMQTGPEGSFVYVARDDQTVEVRRIRATAAGPREMIVSAGLRADERVVTDGQLQLAPGSRYEVRSPGGPRGMGGMGGMTGTGGMSGMPADPRGDAAR